MVRKSNLEPRFIDTLFKPYNVMSACLAKQQQDRLQKNPHCCLDCLHAEIGGCDICEHDWVHGTEGNQSCSNCHVRFP